MYAIRSITTTESFNSIIKGINSMADFMETISALSNEQTASIDEINRGINLFSDVIQNTSAIAEENSSSGVELTSQAELLDSQVKKFRLKKN